MSELDIGAIAQLACLLEVNAPKPGNVSPDASFGDTTYEDFAASAAAIAYPLGTASSRPLGATILLAIEATRRWASTNTNLGIVLLLSPLARASATCVADDTDAIPSQELREALARVLADTTVDDACDAYAAIRLASPGGLGTTAEQDVADEPTVSLTAAMRLAADRDGIAREYATDFHATFEIAAPALRAARDAGLDWNSAIVEAFLTLLANSPDSHIVRRAGEARAREVTAQAHDVVALGGVRTPAGRAALARLDASLRDERHLANPGTTADIITAAIFVVLLADGWRPSVEMGEVDATSR